MSSSPFSAPTSPIFSGPSPFEPSSSDDQAVEIATSKPTLDASEVEASTTAIEVIVRWGSDILHIEHMEKPRGFSVGESGDFALPSDKLGAASVDLVAIEAGMMYAVVAHGTDAKITKSGRTLSLRDAAEEGIATPGSSGYTSSWSALGSCSRSPPSTPAARSRGRSAPTRARSAARLSAS
jgi:hypothetical protein